MPLVPLYKTGGFGGEIWRLEIDELTQTLALEIRNQADKQVSFASVNLAGGQINFKDYTPPERWFTGIETAHNGVLLLHNYLNQTTPVHNGLTAVNIVTAETLWSNYTLAFEGMTINGPLLYSTRITPKKLYIADIQTGAMLRPFNPQTDTVLPRNLKLPEMLSAADVPLPALPAIPYGGIVHYMVHNSRRIISLHTGNPQMLQQHLYVTDDTGAFIFEDLLNTGIQKLQPEAFLIHENWLICLVNKTTLMVLQV